MIVRVPEDPGRFSAEAMRTLFAPLHNAPVAIVDLRAARSLTSGTLSSLIGLQRHRRERRRSPVRLVRASDLMERILEAVSVDGIFEIYESLDEALAATLRQAQ